MAGYVVLWEYDPQSADVEPDGPPDIVEIVEGGLAEARAILKTVQSEGGYYFGYILDGSNKPPQEIDDPPTEVGDDGEDDPEADDEGWTLGW